MSKIILGGSQSNDLIDGVGEGGGYQMEWPTGAILCSPLHVYTCIKFDELIHFKDQLQKTL